MKRFFLFITLALLGLKVFAAIQQPLSVDKAFTFSAKLTAPNVVTAHWQVAPGYHLYKARLHVTLANDSEVKLGKIVLPPGKFTQDKILGKYYIYDKDLSIQIPLEYKKNTDPTLLINYQGCADSGFCYPSVTQQLALNSSGKITTTTLSGTIAKDLQLPTTVSEQDKISGILAKQNLLIILLSFFGFGLLLTFTPCVLPMLPILSGIIVGQSERLNTHKALTLSAAYVFSMALTYAGAGILAGVFGEHLQSALQSPVIVSIFSLVFVLLALSLFGLYELRLPNKLQHHLTQLSNKQRAGSYLGAAIMGCLSTLIVSPCVSAPLVGALTYIGETGNAALGGIALFSMGLGMGIPLIIIGTSAGKLLPKAGPWMDNIKIFFGFMMLGLAIWLLDRVAPPQLSSLLWAMLSFGSASYLFFKKPLRKALWNKFEKILGLSLASYGALLIAGLVLGSPNPLLLLTNGTTTFSQADSSQSTYFKSIKGLAQLHNNLASATKLEKITMVDFYADWCVACKEMDLNTFNDPTVQQVLKNFTLLRADITANDIADKTLLNKYRVIAPPTILFFDQQGKELTNYRIVGEMGPDQFLLHLRNITADQKV